MDCWLVLYLSALASVSQWKSTSTEGVEDTGVLRCPLPGELLLYCLADPWKTPLKQYVFICPKSDFSQQKHIFPPGSVCQKQQQQLFKLEVRVGANNKLIKNLERKKNTEWDIQRGFVKDQYIGNILVVHTCVLDYMCTLDWYILWGELINSVLSPLNDRDTLIKHPVKAKTEFSIVQRVPSRKIGRLRASSLFNNLVIAKQIDQKLQCLHIAKNADLTELVFQEVTKETVSAISTKA